MHHWLIPQNGWGAVVPDVIKNQPFNLMPLNPQEGIAQQVWHNAIEGKGEEALLLPNRLWYGSPNWAKAGAASFAGKVFNGERNWTSNDGSSLFFNGSDGGSSSAGQSSINRADNIETVRDTIVLDTFVVTGHRSDGQTYTVTPGPSFGQQWADLQKTLGHRPNQDEWWNRDFSGGAPGSLRAKVEQMMRTKTPEEVLEEEYQKRMGMQVK